MGAAYLKVAAIQKALWPDPRSLAYHEVPVMPPLEIGARADEHIRPDMEGVLVQYQHAGKAVPIQRQGNDPAERMECANRRHGGGGAGDGALCFHSHCWQGK